MGLAAIFLACSGSGYTTEESDSRSTVFHYAQVVDVLEELVKFTLLLRDQKDFLVDRYSERKEIAEQLYARVNQRTIWGAQ